MKNKHAAKREGISLKTKFKEKHLCIDSLVAMFQYGSKLPAFQELFSKKHPCIDFNISMSLETQNVSKHANEV